MSVAGIDRLGGTIRLEHKEPIPLPTFVLILQAKDGVGNEIFGDASYRHGIAQRCLGPANISVLRRRALDVARCDKTKGSLTGKIKCAGWNEEFLIKMLSQMR